MAGIRRGWNPPIATAYWGRPAMVKARDGVDYHNRTIAAAAGASTDGIDYPKQRA
jgi:hypothetical protein